MTSKSVDSYVGCEAMFFWDMANPLPEHRYFGRSGRVRGDGGPVAVAKAIAGHPVIVSSKMDCFHLFHVLDRSPAKHVYRLVLKQTGEGQFTVIALPKEPMAGVN